jgi:hypothetical protein
VEAAKMAEQRETPFCNVFVLAAFARPFHEHKHITKRSFLFTQKEQDMAYQLTEKSRNLIKTKIIGGQLYALCDKSNDKELWVAVMPPEVDSCSRCGYSGVAIDRHHVHGRKNSKETIILCANCHREVHAGA